MSLLPDGVASAFVAATVEQKLLLLLLLLNVGQYTWRGIKWVRSRRARPAALSSKPKLTEQALTAWEQNLEEREQRLRTTPLPQSKQTPEQVPSLDKTSWMNL